MNNHKIRILSRPHRMKYHSSKNTIFMSISKKLKLGKDTNIKYQRFANQQLKELMDKALLKFRSNICSNCSMPDCRPNFFTFKELNGEVNISCRNFFPRTTEDKSKDVK